MFHVCVQRSNSSASAIRVGCLAFGKSEESPNYKTISTVTLDPNPNCSWFLSEPHSNHVHVYNVLLLSVVPAAVAYY